MTSTHPHRWAIPFGVGSGTFQVTVDDENRIALWDANGMPVELTEAEASRLGTSIIEAVGIAVRGKTLLVETDKFVDLAVSGTVIIEASEIERMLRSAIGIAVAKISDYIQTDETHGMAALADDIRSMKWTRTKP